VSAAPLAAADKVATAPLAVTIERAFPNVNIQRPILLTHAGDGTNRVFVPSQYGVIYVFPNRDDVQKPQVFLDISKRVTYKDSENEEGCLGLAFHPKYKENGQFFAYYVTATQAHTIVVSRFRVSKDNPNRADPSFEEELLRVPQPFWNHKGGTIVFGPDGYLYIALGDGGDANDPFENGQNLRTLLGKVLRIDVDRRDEGLKYAIPRDNPFAGRKDARGEIWAYGLRNIWRMSFDRRTGTLWAGDVGQNLWEEIDLIVKGCNYGWNIREAMHPFGRKGVGPRPDLSDPIWEYHHDVGKSITGGHVYRGTKVPQLQGAYLYGDYVTARIWALRYDEKAKKVTHNQPIEGNILPIMSFGEDEEAEVYFTRPEGAIMRFKAK
jgi:glucose/arabinose dehydrogenase